MKVITSIKSLDYIDKINADGLIFNHKFLSDHPEGYLQIDDIKNLLEIKNKKDVLIIANCNRIFQEDELKELYSLLDNLIAMGVDYFIFSDFAVLSYFKTKQLEAKLIYHARPIITNREDALFYQQQGIFASFIANELTLEELKDISKINNMVLTTYGHVSIYYSKRDIVSLYFDYYSKQEDYKYKKLDLIEEKRQDKYPLIESDYESYIYSPYKYGIFKELKELRNLSMINISSVFVDEKDLVEIVNIYKEYIDSDFNEKIEDELYNRLLSIDSNLNNEFLDQKTVLLKGDNP